MKRGTGIVFLVIPALFITSGCAELDTTEKRATASIATGAVAGQLIGANTKSTLIGAGVGMIGGAILDQAVKNSEKDKGESSNTTE